MENTITYDRKLELEIEVIIDSRGPLQPIEKFFNRLEEMNHSYEFVIEERAGHITDIVKSEKRILTLSRSIDYLNKILA